MNSYLQDLPMGKYIVCGEAHKEGHVVQANCFETVIDRLDNNSEIEFCENIIWQRYFYQNDDYVDEEELRRKKRRRRKNMLMSRYWNVRILMTMSCFSVTWGGRWSHLRCHHLHLLGIHQRFCQCDHSSAHFPQQVIVYAIYYRVTRESRRNEKEGWVKHILLYR